eukprot:7353240-Prymnesium_polylepis.1
MGYHFGEGLGRRGAEGRVACLEVEHLPSERKLSLDGVGDYREAQAQRAQDGHDGPSARRTGVKRGGAGRNRGDAGRRRRARRKAGLDPAERAQIDRALARGPEPPDVFDFMNAKMGDGKPEVSEAARRGHERQQLASDKK